MSIVTANVLSFGYRRQPVFSDLTLCIGPGVTGLLGPNGAGKSSLLALLATRRLPAVGELSVLGDNVLAQASRERARRRIGYLEQRYSLVGSMRVIDTVAYAAWAQGLSRRACFDAAEAALELVELSDKSSRRIRTLSGGQKQRVGIAASMVHHPELLLLDEPTSGLDPEVRISLRRTLNRLGRSISIILSTHLVEDVSALCDEVIVIDEGRIVFQGGVDELSKFSHDEPESNPDRSGGSPLERGYAAVLEDARSHAK